MNRMLDLRCGPDDAAGLRDEIERRNKIIRSLIYQVEHNLNAQDTDYGLLQATFILEDQVHQRTGELKRTLAERDAAQQEAQAVRLRLEAAVDSVSDGFVLFDPDDRLLLCNRSYQRLWGLPGDLRGRHFDELLAEAAQLLGIDNPDWLRQRLSAHRSGVGTDAYALPGGMFLQVRERKTSDGCTVGIHTDITDLKEQEARLRQQVLAAKSRLLQSTLDAIAQGIAVFDRTLGLVAWNPRFFELHDLPRDMAVAGRPLVDFLAVDPGLVSATGESAVAALALPDAFEREVGSGRILELQRSPMPDGGFVLTASDVTDRRRIERQVLDLLERQQVIFDNASVGIVFIREHRILNCNQRMAEIFGFASPHDLIGEAITILYASYERWERDDALRRAALGERGCAEDELELQRRDGTPLWVRRTGRTVNPGQPDEGSIWVFEDITEKRQAASELHLARMVFENSSEALMVTDANNVIVSVNRAFSRISGYPAGEIVGKTPSLLKSGAHEHEFYAEMWETLQRDGCWDGEMIDRRRNGELYPKHVAISVVRNEQGEITNYVAAFSDITERKAAEERIRFLAHHDSLTGLPNRALISDRFEQMRRRVSRQDGFIAVCFLDLDQFKRVNDTLGHRVGDALIVEVSRRLCGCLRQSDTVSRFGGDEFVLLLEGLTVPGQFAGIVEKIFTTFDAPVAIGSHLLPVSASIGVAVYPNDGEDFDTLLQKADTAMYHSKGRGRATFSFFDEKMNRDTASRLDIAMRLRGALQRDELRLAYQPQFALPDCRVVGVEALLRWHSDIYGDAAPDHFIPIAEETGQILAIGTWVLETACRQARRWAEAGSPLRMAVNVSSVQIYRDDFVAVLRQVLERTGVDPRLLEIEITESTVMADTDTIREVFSQVRQLGVAVAIDDFGTGYSSLAYLRRFHVGKLKVDRSFVRDLPGNEEARAIAEAIVRMGQSLHLVVIAEGVETSEQLDFLVTIGYDEVQGYLLGRPMPAAQLDGLLADGMV